MVAIASSLSDVMSEVRTEFIAENPEIEIVFNTASSGILAQQIEQNAPIDIFASADLSLIEDLIDHQKITPKSSRIFAQNTLVLASSLNSELKLGSLDDLLDRQVSRIALGNPNLVPAGNYAKVALGRSPTEENLYRTLEQDRKLVFAENVRQVLAYLEAQAVDVGFIYKTDLRQTYDVQEVLSLSSEKTGEISYAIAPVSHNQTKNIAKQFIDFILSEKGQEIISDYGFLKAMD